MIYLSTTGFTLKMGCELVGAEWVCDDGPGRIFDQCFIGGMDLDPDVSHIKILDLNLAAGPTRKPGYIIVASVPALGDVAPQL